VEIALMLLSFSIAVAGIFGAYVCYIKKPHLPDSMTKGQWGYDLIKNKYEVDEFYDEAFVKPTVEGSLLLWKECDAKGIDGAVNGVALTLGWISKYLRLFQSGFVRNYALFMVVGFVGLLIISL
jgi:NADH-quinone oxidoreductase subunit L